MNTRLQIVPNTNPDYPDHKWAIVEGKEFRAYSNRLLTAHMARIEIEKNLKRCRELQSDEPMTPLRRVYWNAARRA